LILVNDLNKTIQGKLISEIKSLLTLKKSIEGLFLFGSVARRDFTFFSDIDLAVIGDYKKVIKVLRDLVIELKVNIHHYFAIKPNLFIIYIDEPIRKIEFHIYPSIDDNDLVKIIKGSKIHNIDDCILIDNKGDIKEIIMKIAGKESIDFQDVIVEIANRFVNYLESSIYYHGRGDTYRSYFLYNLAVHQLSKIHNLEKGQSNYLYNPSFVFLTIDEIDRERYNDLNGTFNPMEMRNKFWRLFTLFSDTIKRIKENMRIEVDLDNLTRIIMMSLDRDRYYNFRDVATIPNQIKPVLREKVLYRSSTLSKYAENEEFMQFIKEKEIQTIIDIRGMEETLAKPYNRSLREIVRVMHFPLELEVKELERDVFKGLNEVEIFFLAVLLDHGKVIREIVKLLAKEKTGATVLHCYAGKDRTGIVIAIILELLGIPRYDILFDYLSSCGRVNKDTLRIIFDEIDRREGIENFMSEMGISEEIVYQLRKRLLLRGKE